MTGRITLTKDQARRFILLKHGLLGDYQFAGKQGVVAFIRQAGCIQFDPVDVCGKNAELVLHSRVKGFTKELLYSLLYEERALLDYFDKNLSIIATADWPYFNCLRHRNRTPMSLITKNGGCYGGSAGWGSCGINPPMPG